MIEVRGLTRYYGDHKAVDNLNFSIESNEIIGFLGLNGAGKTTVLKMLAGILHPTVGDILIDGVNLLDAPLEARKRLGFLPEIAPLYKEMVVRDYLQHVGQLRGMTKEAVDSSIAEIAVVTDIDKVLDKVIETLSYGYQKRVGIAQAIIHRPSLVILDEPIGGLDPVQIAEMRRVIEKLSKTCTVLLSSHILSEVALTCNRLLILKRGQLVANGTIADLIKETDDLDSKSVSMELRTNPENLDELLKNHQAIVNYQVSANQDGVISVRLTMKDDNREKIVEDLVQNGIGVRKVGEVETNLEKVFARLTGE